MTRKPAEPTSLAGHRTLGQAAAAVRGGALSPVTLVEEAMAAAVEHQHLNAIAHLDVDAALTAARELEQEAAAGRFRGPLHGVPVTVKELYAVAGVAIRAGTRAPLPQLTANANDDATCVARLRAAGALVLATTNMVEIALGITGENSWTGDVRNPYDPTRQAGGSSSGAAVAVATGIGLAALGTDTAGSIRIPAALCGVVGVKPTHGLVPLDGALPLSPTCDHGGPLARTVTDARLLLDVLTEGAVTGSPPSPSGPWVLGVPRDHLRGALDAPVREEFEQLLERAAAAGAQVVDITPAHLDDALTVYTPLVRAEAAYVHRGALVTHPEGFSPGIRTVLEEGRAVPAVRYLAARQARRDLRAGLAATFERVDALVLPTTPVPAPPLGPQEVQVESGRVSHRDAFLHLTVAFSFAGVPAVTLPYAVVEGLPLGVQVVTAAGADRRALDVAAWLEGRTLER